MKKIVSRALALMLCLVMLAGMMPAALAQDLGSREEIEQLLFDVVLEKFPASTPEEQFIYTSYYEQQNEQVKVDTLLGTLTDEQMVAYINYTIEHQKHTGNCTDECNYAECDCICHKVDRFTLDMQELIDSLAELDMDEAEDYIFKLRQDEYFDYLLSQHVVIYGPEHTAGADYSIISTRQANDVDTLNDEELIEDQTDAEKNLAKFNEINDGSDSIGSDIENVLQSNVNTEESFSQLYSDSSDLDTYMSSNEETVTTFSNISRLRSAVSGNVSTLALSRAASGITTVGSAEENTTISLFNYDNAYLANGILKFSQTDYDGDGKTGADDTDPSAVDGEYTPGTNAGYPPIKNTLNSAGYPVVTYDSKDYSLQYLFDPNSSAHKGTVNGNTGLFKRSNGYLVYDSSINAARFESGKFKLYNIPVMPDYAWVKYTQEPSDVQAGNFLPFNDPTNVTAVERAEGTYSAATKYTLNNPVDLWFGMHMSSEFYIPKGGKASNGDMIFEFRGDDDVWVFLNGVLVLDIGGTHGSYPGTINFATGEVAYQHSVPTGGTGTGEETTTLKALFEAAGKYDATKFDENRLKDYEPVKIDFFYLERGSNISYCKLKFNLPTLPDGGLTVSKVMTGDPTDTVAESYRFKLEKQAADGTYAPVEGASYKVTSIEGLQIGEILTSGTGGLFELEANQNATFTALPSQQTYRITELTPSNYVDETKTGWTVTDSNGSKETVATSALVYISPQETGDENARAIVAVDNTLKTTTFELKKLVIDDDIDLSRKYTFNVKVFLDQDETKAYRLTSDNVNAGQTACTINQDGTADVLLAHNESFAFKNLPIGAKVKIEETDADIDEYTTSFESANTVADSSDATLAATHPNTTTEHGFVGYIDLVQDGEGEKGSTLTATNLYNYGSLTIKKNVDADDVAIDNNDTGKQTFLFKVTDESGNVIEVVLAANDEATINKLRHGTYKVEENEAWSWRYDLTGENNRTVIISPENFNPSVTFENIRTETLWLDGSDYANNQFDGSVSDLENN